MAEVSPEVKKAVDTPLQEKIAPEYSKSEISQPVRKESARPKTTLNLGHILKPASKQEETKPEEKNGSAGSTRDQPVSEKQVKEAWIEYAEERKNQVAEYHLLNREFEFSNNRITIPLTNPIEEPLLLSIKGNLIDFLRGKLNNNSIQVSGRLQEFQQKKVAYTNKDKFEHLVEKNPILNELRDRFGLDPDF